MAKPRKKDLPHGSQKDWVRTGGASGDPTMAELDDFNRKHAGVESGTVNVVSDYGGDPNKGARLLKDDLPGAES